MACPSDLLPVIELAAFRVPTNFNYLDLEEDFSSIADWIDNPIYDDYPRWLNYQLDTSCSVTNFAG